MSAVSDLPPSREVSLPAPVALPASIPAVGDEALATTESDLRRAAIRETLAHHAGKTPDANAIAAATILTWGQMAIRLAPVIGARGVDVLIRRALHLTHLAFPWLVVAGGENEEHEESIAPLTSLTACLADREPAVVIEASAALLITFTEQLTTLIGESLTARLLGPVWVSSSPAAEQETAS